MDEDLYDEFGVYIGPDLDDEEGSDNGNDFNHHGAEYGQEFDEGAGNDRMDLDEPAIAQRAVVLHEDKKYYLDASEVYGPNVEVKVQEEDTQNIMEPIVKPEDARRFYHTEREKSSARAAQQAAMKDREESMEDEERYSASTHFSVKWHATTFNKKFLNGLMEVPDLVRNVCIVGHLHHGKTILIDSLVQQTHEYKRQLSRNERYMDSRVDEQDRGMSIKAKPLSLILPNHNHKSYLINIIDTPGHPNFVDEASSAVRLCDGAVFVIDVVEGVTSHTKLLLRHASQERLDIVVVLNKMDRLILELKLPPSDAYFKIRHVLDEINDALETMPQLSQDSKNNIDSRDTLVKRRVSPELGNVIFASGEHSWSFSLVQFASIYGKLHGMKPGSEVHFAKRLWGDIYYNSKTRGFSTRKPAEEDSMENSSAGPAVRTFVQFILEPLYKIYGQVIGENTKDLSRTLAKLDVALSAEELKLDVRPLLKLVLIKFFGEQTGFVDMLVQHVMNPKEAARRKIEQIWRGDLNSPFGQSLIECNPNGPLMIHTTKCYPNPSRTAFWAFGRILSGTVKLGEKLRVLGESFEENQEEDKSEILTGIFTYMTRYMVPQKQLTAGQFVLLEGVDDSIVKTSTITTQSQLTQVTIKDPELSSLKTFKKLHIPTLPVIKIAVEPVNPSELPKLVDGIRKVVKTYPLLETKVEDSGERVLWGTGELYLDTVMHDLNKAFTDIHIKISDPAVTFSETVVDISSIKCFADSTNSANRLTFISEPLEKGFAEDIESGRFASTISLQHMTSSSTTISPLLSADMRNYVQNSYGWDIMSTRNLWAFGFDAQRGPNALINDTIPTEVPVASLVPVRDFIVRGFQWASKEGPLCDEAVRGVKFRLIDAQIAPEPIRRTGTHIIPTARKALHSAFMTATPRLMEPIYGVDIWAPQTSVASVELILRRRRGHIIGDKALPGTPLHFIKAQIPCIDSFGFETDLRSHSHGQAFCLSTFDHWAVVPGDPLDESIIIHPLEPSPVSHLARDFMIKTRRRKGLSEDISVEKSLAQLGLSPQ